MKEEKMMHIKDLYTEEQLIDFMINKWEEKLNTNMTEADWKKYRKQVEYLGLSSWDIISKIEDYYYI